ncbi:hypothetical protein Syun_000338 [Stephania yunnanensis]|uniref:Uncharacterized protein n=1 Tax=Stephania yunnanensis TaxID=152371 RepID=A0AAP0LCZ6_9MAGN
MKEGGWKVIPSFMPKRGKEGEDDHRWWWMVIGTLSMVGSHNSISNDSVHNGGDGGDKWWTVEFLDKSKLQVVDGGFKKVVNLYKSQKRPTISVPVVDFDADHDDVQNFIVEVNVGKMSGVVTRPYRHDGWPLRVRLPLAGINNNGADPCLKIELVQRCVAGVEEGTSTGEAVVGRVRVELVREGKLIGGGKECVNLVKTVQGSCVIEGQISIAINIIEDRRQRRNSSWAMLMNR